MGYPHPSHPKENPVLSKHFGSPEARTFDGWVKRGGYEGLRKVLRMTPEAVVEEIKASGLRGRGGAGFPTGLKWSLMPKADGRPHYLVCNADESEPGTFKDREIMRWTPHQLLEGCAIAAYAIGAERCYIYIRGEFTDPLRIMQQAVEEATAQGALGSNVFGTGKRIEVI
ncbi:MAG: NADH-quinone oxidoreductase subunit F, partial [Gemmatimonadales bacterium]